MTNSRKIYYGKYLRAILSCTDWIFVNIFFAIALHICDPADTYAASSRILWTLVNVSFIPVLFWTARKRYAWRAIQIDRVFLQAISSLGVHALFFMSLNAFIGIINLGEKFYLTYYGMLLPAFALWAVVAPWIIKAFRRKGYNFTRVAIVGTNDTARRLYEQMLSDPGFGYRVMGFFDNGRPEHFHGKYIGSIDKLHDFVSENKIDQIYFTIPGHDDLLSSVVKIADDNVAEFFYVPQISRYISRSFELHSIGSMPVLTTRRNPLKSQVNKIIKRTFDIVVSSIFLCFYPLIYIPVAIGIKLSSPGPVYFRQQRTGYKNQPFTCLKFRTMKVNVDADRAQATADDPRKTRIGDFLRRTSIDELPQFINVWKGDMSIVGPRPHMIKHTEDYSRLVDRYMLRLLIKPGITGWAQVNGFRGQTDELWKMEKRVQHDVWYIENWTLALDLKIVIRTIINAIHGEKNAF